MSYFHSVQCIESSDDIISDHPSWNKSTLGGRNDGWQDFLSLFARTLEVSMYVHRLIGLESLRLAEILTLGMSTM